MHIEVEELSEEQKKPLVTDPAKLGFGKVFTDRMFTARYEVGRGWFDHRIERYHDFPLDPAACVLHYAQEIFEGLKAYASEDGRILLFRPELNARRMNRSARRMAMPEFPEEDFLTAIRELVVREKRWIPRAPETSLYIRPTMIATEAFLGVHAGASYLFYIILSPSGPYFQEGFKPVRLYVEDVYVRAVPGGVGDVKTGGNYAASILAGAEAQKKGFSQVLWLDAKERKYVEEVGAMNIFFVFGQKLVTPALSGSILAGHTRLSILEMAGDLGYETEERPISIDEVVAGAADGTLTEAFGAGTAAVISPVSGFRYKGRDYQVGPGEVGPVARDLYRRLTDLQWGRVPDPYGWVREIGRL
ncbi:MAG: branched-chain amino acid aminotransferase [Bacillota bacterium]|nr:branched-chain amino acid aminotransferase [Bacillota bacterium]